MTTQTTRTELAKTAFYSSIVPAPIKTFSVCPESSKPTIKVNTDGAVEAFVFRTKKQADKKIMALIDAGYTFDATRQTTSQAAA